MIDLSIRRPVATAAIYVALMALGAFGVYLSMPIFRIILPISLVYWPSLSRAMMSFLGGARTVGMFS